MLAATNNAPFHINVLRKGNVWYSVQNGNWDDPATWISNGLAKGFFTTPQINDTVYINHNVVLTFTGVTSSIKHVFISAIGTLSGGNGKQLTVFGNFQCFGLVDFTSSNTVLKFLGLHNRIDNFIRGTSTISYDYNGPEQPILSLDYYNLQANTGQTVANYTPNIVKLMEGNLTVAGVYTAPAGNFAIDVGTFNVLVEGNCAGTLISSGNGTYYFRNGITLGGGKRAMVFTGAPYIEIQGTLTTGAFVFGTGTTKAVADVTNNATTTIATLIIANDVLFRNTTLLTATTFIDGLNAGSTFKNEGQLNVNFLTAPMITGVFDHMPAGFPNSVILYDTTAGVLPFSTYNNLIINGTGTKTPPGNLTVKNLTGASGANGFDFGTFDAVITGTCTSQSANGIVKTGAGTLLFQGLFQTQFGGSYNFSGGNPNVEWRGGWTVTSPGTLGSGVLKFTTNNQTIALSGLTTLADLAIIIEGAITITYTQSTGFFIWTNSTLEGTVSGSTFDCRGNAFTWNTAGIMMNTGVFETNAAVNTVIYGLSGAGQDVRGGTYRNLTLSAAASASAKRLLGNVSVVNTYTLTSPATVNLNGFTLTNP